MGKIKTCDIQMNAKLLLCVLQQFVKKKFGTDLQYSLFNLDEVLSMPMSLVGAGNFVQLSSLAAFKSERVYKCNYF